jgi:hypothetical protein
MILKEAVVAYSRYISGICLGGLGKTKRNLKIVAVPVEILTEDFHYASPRRNARCLKNYSFIATQRPWFTSFGMDLLVTSQ